MKEEHKEMVRNTSQINCYDETTNTLDIRSNGIYPSNVLSNLCSNSFRFDGMVCGSMEGLLQSLKYPDVDKQRSVCSMKGGNARKRSVTSWQTDQIVWWKGTPVDRQGEEFQRLLRKAYQAMFNQSQRFRDALMQTRGMHLVHTLGLDDSYRTILTSSELCEILTELREAYDQREKHLPILPQRIFVVLEGTLLAEASIPENMYAVPTTLLPPDSVAVEALRHLQQSFEVYVLVSDARQHPVSYTEKVKWVATNFEESLASQMLVCPSACLLRGDVLITALGDYGEDFEGERIFLGSEKFPDWAAVIDHLSK